MADTFADDTFVAGAADEFVEEGIGDEALSDELPRAKEVADVEASAENDAFVVALLNDAFVVALLRSVVETTADETFPDDTANPDWKTSAGSSSSAPLAKETSATPSKLDRRPTAGGDAITGPFPAEPVSTTDAFVNNAALALADDDAFPGDDAIVGTVPAGAVDEFVLEVITDEALSDDAVSFPSIVAFVDSIETFCEMFRSEELSDVFVLFEVLLTPASTETGDSPVKLSRVDANAVALFDTKGASEPFVASMFPVEFIPAREPTVI